MGTLATWRPAFVCDWRGVIFLHFAVESARLQSFVPFELDEWDGPLFESGAANVGGRAARAFLTLVAFDMIGFRPCRGGWATRWLTAPIASYPLLNLRTYVRRGGERGIHFIREWVPNRWAVLVGPRTFGLPYRLGRLDYAHDGQDRIEGEVRLGRSRAIGTRTEGPARPVLRYRADLPRDDSEQRGCAPGSLDEFLLERYVAFTTVPRAFGSSSRSRSLRFRIEHRSWSWRPLTSPVVEDMSLLATACPLFARKPADGGPGLIGGHYAPELLDIGIGWPSRIAAEPATGPRVIPSPAHPLESGA